MLFLLAFVLYALCVSIPDSPEEHEMFMIGIAEGGSVVCGAPVTLNLALRARDIWIELAQIVPDNPGRALSSSCTVQLYCAIREVIQGGTGEPVYKRELSVDPVVFNATISNERLVAGKVVVPSFCPQPASETPDCFFAAECGFPVDGGANVVLSGRTPFFSAGVPMAVVTPGWGSLVLAGHDLTVKVALATTNPITDGQPLPEVQLDIFSATDDLAGRDDGVTTTLRDVGDLHWVTQLPVKKARLAFSKFPNTYRNIMDVATVWPDAMDSDDTSFFLRVRVALPTPAEAWVRLVAVAGDGEYECDLVSLAAYFSARSYGIENTLSYGAEVARVTPNPACFEPGTTDPFSLDPVLIFSSGNLHMFVYASEALAHTLLSGTGVPYNVADQQTLLIAFRGTGVGSLADWETNLDVLPVSCDPYAYPCSNVLDDDDSSGQLHGGFFAEYREMRSVLLRIFARIFIGHVKETELNMIFTGHSQGGAQAHLAQLEAADYFRNEEWAFTEGVTFGAPRVGFNDFWASFDQLVGTDHLWRIEHEWDIVPGQPKLYTPVGTLVELPCEHFLGAIMCHRIGGYVSDVLNPTTVEGNLTALPAWMRVAHSEDSRSQGVAERASVASDEAGGLPTLTVALIVGGGIVCCLCLAALVVCVVVALARSRRRRTSPTLKHSQRSAPHPPPPRRPSSRRWASTQASTPCYSRPTQQPAYF
jgi:hypothetical protein